MAETVLITGGLGYLGGRIAQAISECAGLTPLIATRTTIPSRPNWLSRGEVVTCGIEPATGLREALRDATHVVHLAALNENECARHPAEAVRINTLGTLNLLEASVSAGVKKFIYLSTIHVYGSPLSGTITEETLPRPVHPYAITHRGAEDFVLAARDEGRIDGIVVRLSNGYGAPAHPAVDRWTLIGNDLCRQAVTHKKLVLRSAGLQRRDLITLEDVGRAIVHLLNLPRTMDDHGIYNLGGEHSARMIDFAELIAERCECVLGFRPIIERPEPRSGESSEPLEFRIERLKATGFRLSRSTVNAIDETLAFCSQHFGG